MRAVPLRKMDRNPTEIVTPEVVEEYAWGQPNPELDKLRRAAGLKEKNPPPLHKRIARFYDENWETMFDGVGASILVLAMVSLLALIFINIGRTTGWWGGML